MPRKRREESPTGVYHWIARGMNKKDLFHKREDYRRFWELIREYQVTFSIAVYHYCLMTNHVHIVKQASQAESSRRPTDGHPTLKLYKRI